MIISRWQGLPKGCAAQSLECPPGRRRNLANMATNMWLLGRYSNTGQLIHQPQLIPSAGLPPIRCYDQPHHWQLVIPCR